MQKIENINNYNTSLYYWSHNRYSYFIVFRSLSNQIGIKATIKMKEDAYIYQVVAPDWWIGDGFDGEEETFDKAVEQVNLRLKVIIKEEFSL